MDQMVKNGPNGQKWTKNGPKMDQKQTKIDQYGPNGPKWTKMYKNRPYWIKIGLTKS